jgi:hypothetical protein
LQRADDQRRKAEVDPAPPRSAAQGDGDARGANGLNRDQRPQTRRQHAAAGSAEGQQAAGQLGEEGFEGGGMARV